MLLLFYEAAVFYIGYIYIFHMFFIRQPHKSTYAAEKITFFTVFKVSITKVIACLQSIIFSRIVIGLIPM